MRPNVSGPAQDRLDEWERLAEAPLEQLIGAMLATDEHGIDMRQNSPFVAVLSLDERVAAIRRADSTQPARCFKTSRASRGGA